MTTAKHGSDEDITGRRGSMLSGDESGRKNRTILVAGLEHVIAKVARHYRFLVDEVGAEIVLYTRDVSGGSDVVAADYRLRREAVPRSRLRDILRMWRLLVFKRPAHLELYHDSQADVVHIGCLFAAWVLRVPIVLVCRGGELYYWDQHSARRRFVFGIGFRLAKMIVIKELGMEKRLRELGVDTGKCLFLRNTTSIHADEPKTSGERLGVLFLNSWKPWRHPEIAVDVALTLAAEFPEARFTIAGARTWCREALDIGDVRKTIEKEGLGHSVSVEPWVEDPRSLFDRHSIFLLPAEEVFVNYALIEAMERGLVPVVPRVRGSDVIVDDGRCGLIVELDTGSMVGAVRSLLSDPETLNRIALEARRKIESEFNLTEAVATLSRAYRSRVW